MLSGDLVQLASGLSVEQGPDMAQVFVSIGSNQQRRKHIQAGITRLGQRLPDLLISPVYETAAVGFEGDPFLNLVIGFESDESPEALNEWFKAIEIEQGRQQGGKKFAPRTLDLDLLLYGDRVQAQQGLQLPRDEIEKYAFVLQPLADIVPDGVYPGRDQTFAEMWAAALAQGTMMPGQRIEWMPVI